jgi:hypothetical protein
VSSLGENPELVFESQVACAGAGKAAVPSAAKVTSPRAIHDLFERGLTAIEVVVDWLTVVLAVEGAFIASQLLRAGGISRPAFNMAPYVPFVAGPVTKQLLERHACALFVIAIPGLEAERFSRAVKAAEAADATVTFLPRDSGFSLAGIEHADIDGILLNVMGKPEMDWNYEITKCVFDRVTATALLILIAPAWLAIALIVRFDSPGPVLFRHERVGMRGRFFTLYKFRSMYLDTPQYDISPRTSSDARITRIGRFLRRSSLDELPMGFGGKLVLIPDFRRRANIWCRPPHRYPERASQDRNLLFFGLSRRRISSFARLWAFCGGAGRRFWRLSDWGYFWRGSQCCLRTRSTPPSSRSR